MARISFSSLAEELTGKLAGSVFQDSYIGFQIRTRVSPRNPQSYFQQLRRGEFGYLSATWRSLTSTEKGTFITEAGTIPAALRLFVGNNINLSLINVAPITTFTPATFPPGTTIGIDNYASGSLSVLFSSSPATVPTGQALVIFATFEKPATHIFTNPSMYSPIATLAAGSSLSSSIDILSAWQSRYGILQGGGQLCVKSALIDISNGNRTDSVSSCAIQPEMLPYIYYYATLSQTGAADPVATEAPSNTLTPIVWTRTAAGLYEGTSAGLFTAGKTFLASVPIGSGPLPQIQFYRSSINTVNIGTYPVGGSASDDQLLEFGIQILVFT